MDRSQYLLRDVERIVAVGLRWPCYEDLVVSCTDVGELSLRFVTTQTWDSREQRKRSYSSLPQWVRKGDQQTATNKISSMSPVANHVATIYVHKHNQ